MADLFRDHTVVPLLVHQLIGLSKERIEGLTVSVFWGGREKEREREEGGEREGREGGREGEREGGREEMKTWKFRIVVVGGGLCSCKQTLYRIQRGVKGKASQ